MEPTPKPAPKDAKSPLRDRKAWHRFAEDTHKTLLVAGVLITLVGTSAQAALLKLLGLEEPLTLLEVFLRTAPLTVAIALIILIFLSGSDAEERWMSVIFAMIILAIAGFISTAFAGLRVEPVWLGKSGPQGYGIFTPFVVIYAYLRGFYHAYGPPSFWSSVVLGVTLDVILSRSMLLHAHLKGATPIPESEE
jgi:hypothetical protein